MAQVKKANSKTAVMSFNSFLKSCSFKDKLIGLPLNSKELYNFYKSLPDNLKDNIFAEKEIVQKPLSEKEIDALAFKYLELTEGKGKNVFGLSSHEKLEILRQEKEILKSTLEDLGFDKRIDLDSEIRTTTKVVSAKNVAETIKKLLAKQNIKF